MFGFANSVLSNETPDAGLCNLGVNKPTHGSVCFVVSKTGGHTHTRRRLHEPEASAELHTDHVPDGREPCGLGEGRSEAHTSGSLQKPAEGPVRPHRGLAGRSRCKEQRPRDKTLQQWLLTSWEVTLLDQNVIVQHSPAPVNYSYRADKHFIGSTSSTPSTTRSVPASCGRFTWKQTTTLKESTSHASSRCVRVKGSCSARSVLPVPASI